MGIPTGTDNIVGNGLGAALLSAGTTAINNITPNGNGTWIIEYNTATGSASYVINGTATINAGNILTFRNSGATGTMSMQVNQVDIDGGTLNLGASGEYLSSLTGTGSSNPTIIFSGATTTGSLTISTAGDYNIGSVSTDSSFTGSASMVLAQFTGTGGGPNTTRNATFTGLDSSSSGTLAIYGGGGNLLPGLAVTMTLDESTNHSFNGILANNNSGSAILSLDKTGTGTQILTGSSTYTGGTVIDNGMLQLGAGGTTGSIKGNVNMTSSSAILAFDRSNAFALSGTITGSGQVQQIGSGTTTLSAANSYTGATTVSAGTLLLTDTSGAGTGAVNLSGGTLNVNTGVSAGIANSSVTFTNAASSYILQRAAIQAYNAYSSSSALGGHNTNAALLNGTAGGTRTLTTSFATTSAASNDSRRVSDVFSLSGAGTDTIVLELQVSTTLSTSAFLGWLNGGSFVTATMGNTGSGTLAGSYNESYSAFLATNGGSFNATTMLGAFGVDTTNGAVWAVLNNASGSFAVLDTPVPEPATPALLAGGLGMTLLLRQRAWFI